WVAPGAAAIPSSRGRAARVAVRTGDARETARFAIPLAGRPRARDREWSPWIAAEAPLAGFALRYRVVPRSAVVRRERVGPFVVDLVARDFAHVDPAGEGGAEVAAQGVLLVRDGDALAAPPGARTSYPPGTRDHEIGADVVVLVPGGRPALIAAGGIYGYGTLLVAEGGRVAATSLERSDPNLRFHPITNDDARFHAARTLPIGGRVDRTLLAEPGAYAIGQRVFDTRTLAVRPLPEDSTVASAYEAVPIGVSPDGRGVVRHGERGESSTSEARTPVLVVGDLEAGTTYTLPIDRARMRYVDVPSLDPAWLQHHFEWRRGDDGAHRLAERASFVPLPHRGAVDRSSSAFPVYRVVGASAALADVVADEAARALGGERLPPAGYGEVARVRVGERTLAVHHYDAGGTVELRGEGWPDVPPLIERAARAVDAVLATGRHDALFTAAPR
ncbi:hypothetical protein, partial [Roseisolibacter sp. H3M3-2]|uniref:hypothetical protein n=1 Tax=Roseisolibacter sp. H3M3-2 TaxID=3031323 RepID=UPI0023DA4B1D